MQLGTRWALDATPPAQLPAAVVRAVRGVEAELAEYRESGRSTEGWRWTLTWLEGRPIVDLDDGTSIRYDEARDLAVVIEPQD